MKINSISLMLGLLNTMPLAVLAEKEVAIRAKPDKPNIIFILADDLGYGELGCYGQQKILTPGLDTMAKEGMRFTHHFAGGSVCGPSRASLMTGQSQAIGFIKGNPGRNPMRENLRAEDVTVAELLRGAGYETACIGKWGLGPKGMSGYPLNQGFDYFMGYDTHKSAHNYYPKTLCENNVERELPGNKTEPKMQYSHDVFAKKAMGFVQRKHEKPYFLYLNYTIPHSPYDPPDIKPYGNKAWSSTKKKYAAMITRMDRDIGELIEQVKLSDENTLIIFASDNGPQSGGRTENDITSFFNSNGDMRGIKRDVYNGGVRVPFIAWWPGKVKPGTVNAHISGFQDFLPTVCELAGIQTDVQTDGISYLPTLLGQKGKQRDHEWMYWEFLWMPQDEKNISGRQAVLSPKLGFKAVRYGRKSPVELYKFESDTGEDSDVAKKFPEVANKMSRYLDRCRGKSDLWPIRFHDKPFISTFSPNYKKKGK